MRFLIHYRALCYKSLLLKMREMVRTIVEIVVPAIFTLLLAIGYWLASNPSSQATIYADGITVNLTQWVTDIPDLFADDLFFFCQNTTAEGPPLLRRDSTFEPCPLNDTKNLECLDAPFQDICFYRHAWGAMNSIVALVDELPSSFIPFSLSSYLALARWVYLKHPDWDNFGEHSPRMSLFHTGYLMLVGTEEQTAPFRAYIGNTSELARRVLYPNVMMAEEAENYAYENGAQVWAILDLSDASNLQYTIRMNFTATPWTFGAVREYTQGLGSRNDLMYLNSGFLTLQQVVNTYLMQQRIPIDAMDSSVLGPLPDLAFTAMPTRGFATNNFLVRSGQFIPLVMTFGFLYALSRLLSLVVEEKEAQLKEAMLIMGLNPAAFYGSWLTVSLVMNLLACLACSTTGKLTFFNDVDWLLLFVLNFGFACTISGVGFVLSTLFNRAKVAALVGPLILFVSTVPHYAIPEHTSVHVLYAASLLPCTAYAQAIKSITDLVTAGVTVGWADIYYGDYSIAAAIGFMVLDSVLYLLIALYLDLVVPGEHGRPLHPLFFLPRSLQCHLPRFKPSAVSFPVVSLSRIEEAEHRDPSEPVAVEVREISKRYSSQPSDSPPAVDKLSFSIHLNEIFVLLGHNGAGKSTTMHIITGMVPPSAGDVFICGHSIFSDRQAARENIGFCPQHNVLWPTLSVREHLRFFAVVKGAMAFDRAKLAAIDMAKRVDLLDQFDVPVQALSGGQKRKLSVGIALIADSKFVLLDEPTAGMDVNARRHLWDLLTTERQGRSVLISTHYMDEADILGDRIAIMDHGCLHSLGSSLFLKSQLGSGYTMHLVLRSADCIADALHLVRRECPGVTPVLDSNTGEIAVSMTPATQQAEIAVSLPHSAVANSAQAARLFESLEDEEAINIGVMSYGLGLTTLEDVFVKITTQGGASNSPAAAAAAQEASIHVEPEVNDRTPLINASTAPPHDTRTFTRHLTAMLIKRLHCAKRDRKAQCFQVVLPILFMAIALLLLLLKPPAPPAMVLDSSMYANPYSEVLIRNGTASHDELQNLTSNFDTHYVVSQYEGPLENYSALVLSHILLEQLFDHPLDRWFAIANRDQQATLQGNQTVILYNATALHAVPQSIEAMATAVLRERTHSSSLRILVTNHPLPISKYEKQVIDAVLQIVSALFILIPFTFIPAQFVRYVVKEREIKAKHQQWVSGANTAAYWASTVIFDILSYLVTECLAIAIFFAFKREEFIGDAATFAATFLLFFFYGLSMVPGCCLISFLFERANPAQNVVMLGNFFCGFLMVLAAQILSTIDSTRSANEALCWVYRLIPSYCLGEGIIVLTARDLSGILLDGRKPGAFDLVRADKNGGFVGGVGTSLIYMGCTAPVFFLALFFVERWRVTRYKLMLKAAAISLTSSEFEGEPEDDDVREERRAVEATEQGRREDCLTVLRLTKKFTNRTPPKVAVRNVSFGVHRGEIFAFLGTNGAGKTTTMGILTGDIVQSSGRAFIGNWDVSLFPDKTRMLVGYCPQFDALFPEMTPIEHMYLYCRLKGVPESQILPASDRILIAMGVYPYRDKPVRDLSGGNKRKLSIAIALVGDPSVLLLDEPSAGMDPLARRELWSSLRVAAQSRSVVLTTHHLEEVEALAHRAAIMVAGSLRCVGTLQHLKSRFGGGTYEMEVRCGSNEQLDLFIDQAQREIGAELLERHGSHGHFTLRTKRGKLSHVFKFIGSVTERCGIVNFAVNQTSIEQVFLRISAENDDNDDQNRGPS